MTDWPDLCLRLLRVCVRRDIDREPDVIAAQTALLRHGEPWMASEVLRLRGCLPLDREGPHQTLTDVVDRAVWQERYAEQVERTRMVNRQRERD